MEKFLKALWEIFMDHSRGASERAAKEHNEYIDNLYETKCTTGQMPRVQAEGWKSFWKI